MRAAPFPDSQGGGAGGSAVKGRFAVFPRFARLRGPLAAVGVDDAAAAASNAPYSVTRVGSGVNRSERPTRMSWPDCTLTHLNLPAVVITRR